MYLVDTNIWLELLLDQTRAREVAQFLDQVPSDRLLISDFSFHSIGIVLIRLGQEKAFLRFVKDAFIDGAVAVVSVKPQDMEELVEVITEFGLDFDDAYQYLVARLANAVIVSFDSDFDKTETGKKTPGEVQEPD